MLGLLDAALTHLYSTPDPDHPNSYVVDVAAISQWLADQIDDELDRIQHER